MLSLPSLQRPVTRSFDVFFDLRRNKRLSYQSRRQWFETPLCSLWRHCNVQAQWWPNARSSMTTSWHGNDFRMAFVRGIHRSPVDSPYNGPVMQSLEVFFGVSLKKWLNKQLVIWRHDTGASLSWHVRDWHFEDQLFSCRFRIYTDLTMLGTELPTSFVCRWYQIDGLMQERRNCSVLAMELHLSCTNQSKLSLMVRWRLPKWQTRFFQIYRYFMENPNDINSSPLFALAGLVLGLHSANERCHYKVTPSLFGWSQP